MNYRTLIENVANYGHGVFALTMVFDELEKAALTKFIQRNPNHFTQFKGKQGDLKLISLSSEGKKYFNLKVRLSNSTTWQSLLDIALFNAYMAEKNQWAKQSNKPLFLLNLGQEKIGLISSRWGISKNFKEASILLATELQKKSLLKDSDYISKTAKQLAESEEKIRELIINSYTPKAFLNLRR